MSMSMEAHRLLKQITSAILKVIRESLENQKYPAVREVVRQMFDHVFTAKVMDMVAYDTACGIMGEMLQRELKRVALRCPRCSTMMLPSDKQPGAYS